MTLVLDNDTRRGHCTNLSCQGSNLNTEEGNLIELFALAKAVPVDGAIQQLAQSLNVPLLRKELQTAGGEINRASSSLLKSRT